MRAVPHPKAGHFSLSRVGTAFLAVASFACIRHRDLCSDRLTGAWVRRVVLRRQIQGWAVTSCGERIFAPIRPNSIPVPTVQINAQKTS